MSANEAVNRALGRIAEILLERGAKVDLNGILDVLEELRQTSYLRGYDDGVRALDELSNEAAGRAYESRFREFGVGE